jgi:citrate lyase subunit beta/citryl-CoA lyase
MGPALLFCPADRPERFGKAAERSDGVVLDLEDAVRPEAKAAARSNIAEAEELDPERTLVRISAACTSEAEADLEALSGTPLRTLVLAKAQAPGDAAWVLDRMPDARIIAQIESAAGVMASAQIAAVDGVAALSWGSEDLLGTLGGRSSRLAGHQFGKAGVYREVIRVARAQILLGAAAHGKAAVDAVHVDIADREGLAAEAADASASGFAASFCIHPGQVPIIRTAYAPTPGEISEAERLVAAAHEAVQHGAFRFEGRMIDPPLVAHAERVLAHAERARRYAG